MKKKPDQHNNSDFITLHDTHKAASKSSCVHNLKSAAEMFFSRLHSQSENNKSDVHQISSTTLQLGPVGAYRKGACHGHTSVNMGRQVGSSL